MKTGFFRIPINIASYTVNVTLKNTLFGPYKLTIFHDDFTIIQSKISVAKVMELEKCQCVLYMHYHLRNINDLLYEKADIISL